jgi:hypothetical protein
MTRAVLTIAVCLACMFCAAQAPPPLTVTNENTLTFFHPPSKPYDPVTNISGMYTFLKEGEFVQLTEEDETLSGFLSRFGDTESDKGEFIDQFFDKASVQAGHISFNTKTVHAMWYEFDGTVMVEPGKKVGEEGYRLLRGKLTMHRSDALGKDQASERTVEFHSFPDAQHMRN